MAKNILIHSKEPGRICDVVGLGKKFDVHPDFEWIRVENDEVTREWTYSFVDGVFTVSPPDLLADPVFQTEGYKIARVIAYKDVGEQLDMLFREVRDNGTISATGEWFQHVESVKAAVPKDDPAAVLQWYNDNASTE